MSELLERLAGLPLFSGLTPEELSAVAGLGLTRAFSRGQIIFSEGEEGRGFHLLIEGRVKVFKTSPEGKEQILHIWGPGQIFGEVPVFAGGCYPAHAESLDASRTLFLPRAGLLEHLRSNPELGLKLLAALSRRLHHFAGLIEDLSLREVPGRLAAYLLELTPRQAGAAPVVELEVSKGQLASLLGTIPETLSRILSRMAKEGLLEAAGPRGYRLLDVERLLELADGRRRLSG